MGYSSPSSGMKSGSGPISAGTISPNGAMQSSVNMPSSASGFGMGNLGGYGGFGGSSMLSYLAPMLYNSGLFSSSPFQSPLSLSGLQSPLNPGVSPPAAPQIYGTATPAASVASAATSGPASSSPGYGYMWNGQSWTPNTMSNAY